MARLILKSPFIKGGSTGGGKAGRYAKYIGTRKGVELLPSGYAEYMSERPRSHGLFGDEDHVDLKKVTAELDTCEKNVWTHIVSLKREDAARLGYDNAKAWRDLIRAHRNDIAATMNIPPNDFRWCAAFHDEGEHPHIHMIAWSAGEEPGYLSKTGIRQIKSELTNDIFRQEMLYVYEQKSQSRDELVTEARRTMLKLTDEMKRGACEHPEVEQLMLTLSHDLKNVKGKKQYGYLSKPLKKQVDEIVDQMARLPSVKNCYETWLELQQQVNEFYSGKPMEQVPLSQQKEFRAIHNAVIQAAVQMDQITFEDRSMQHSDEPDDVFCGSDSCRMIWSVLCDDSLPLEMKDKGVARLHSKAEHGEPLAQLLLGRLYRDGPLLTPDWVEAQYWFEQAAQTLPDARYALGKLLLTDDPEVHNREQGLRYLTKAAENGHDYAAYRLGKELIKGRKINEALPGLKMAANADNPYAEYLLGKMLWEGADGPKDKEQAIYWLGQAADQGHSHAQLLLERQNGSSLPSAILAVNGLLQQMGRIFQNRAQAIRKGELVALLWDDLDIQNRTISVTKQYIKNPNGKLTLSRPKTETSVRKVSIPQEAVDLLIQEHNKHPHNPYMFPSSTTGEMYYPDSVVKLHQKILKDAGLEHISFHALRHTFATLALQNGIDIKTVSNMLGHYDAGFTLRTYTHATRQVQDQAAETMGSFMAQMM